MGWTTLDGALRLARAFGAGMVLALAAACPPSAQAQSVSEYEVIVTAEDAAEDAAEARRDPSGVAERLWSRLEPRIEAGIEAGPYREPGEVAIVIEDAPDDEGDLSYELMTRLGQLASESPSPALQRAALTFRGDTLDALELTTEPLGDPHRSLLAEAERRWRHVRDFVDPSTTDAELTFLLVEGAGRDLEVEDVVLRVGWWIGSERAREMDAEWVAVSGAPGWPVALQVNEGPQAGVIVFPFNMIAKRIDRVELFSPQSLVDGALAALRAQR